MTSTSPVVLILGAGANIGQHVAQAFATKGYKVALVARSVSEGDSTADRVYISSDLSDPNNVVKIFSTVEALLGVPSVVVYNAAARTSYATNKPLSLGVADFTRNLNINTVSAFAAAQQASLAFERLPNPASRTFIYTGNVLNTTTMASLLDLGVGKTATAHIIQSAALAYKERGFKFYYADERKADGSPPYSNIDGEAHGKFYVDLAEGESQGPWQQTFVKEQGYKRF
ncbi:hypothetical protein MBLNU459_g3839t1 [Dothideomycetes sp. NU459]